MRTKKSPACELLEGQLFKRSLASVKQNCALTHFQSTERF